MIDKEQLYSKKHFLRLVDATCYSRLGCSMHDLPDFPYYDYYDEEINSLKELENAADMCVEDLVNENMNDYSPMWI